MRSPLPHVDVVRAAVVRAWPGPRFRKVRVDETGWTNLMFEADGKWMVRVPRWREAARSLDFEVRLLDYLGRRLRARVPRPEIVGSLDQPPGWPFFAYRKLPGRPLHGIRALTSRERTDLVAFLGRLFVDLRGCSSSTLVRIGVRPGDRGTWAERYRRLRARFERVGRGSVPERLTRNLRATLDALDETLAESHFRPVLLHNDLWPSHLLWQRPPGRPAGVIDWEDARFGDPAQDLTALEGLGVPGLTRLARERRARSDRGFWQRLSLYRQLLPLGGLLYGLEIRDRSLFDRHREELTRSLARPSAEVRRASTQDA